MTETRETGGRPALSRRSLLVAIPVAGAAAVIPALAKAVATDPHPEWLKRWRELCEAYCAHPTGEGPDADLLNQQRYAIEDLISKTKAETLAGILAQVEWLVEDCEDYWCRDDHAMAASNIVSALREALA